MRNLDELRINERGKPVSRPPPLPADVRAFEAKYGVTLPQEYLELLRHANGGHPALDSVLPAGRPDAGWAVNRFYDLGSERTSATSLWSAMEDWRPILGRDAIPFAQDGGGNQFFLDLKASPPSVKVCIHDEQFAILDLAPSFGAFIDALSEDPEMI